MIQIRKAGKIMLDAVEMGVPLSRIQFFVRRGANKTIFAAD